jgi:hypothetical protein
VADYHTYFVGCQEWGFSVWAHNASCDLLEAINDILVKAGKQPLNQRQVDSLWGTLRRGVPEDDVAALGKKLLGQGPDGSLRKLLGRKLTETEADTLAKAAAKGTRQFDPVFRAAEAEAERLAAEQAAQQALARSQAAGHGITTPNSKLQQWAKQGGYVDPRTNKWVAYKGTLAADHVYPKELIEKLPGFDKLTPAQKEFLLNYPGNFEPLPTHWNSSKLNRLADEWAKTPMGRQASKEYIDALRERQQAFEGFAKNLIAFWGH